MSLIDRNDPLWPRVVAAFCGITGPPEGLKDGLSGEDFAHNRIMEFIKSVVRNYESTEALKPAPAIVAAAAAKVETDFDAQFVKPVIVKDEPIVEKTP